MSSLGRLTSQPGRTELGLSLPSASPPLPPPLKHPVSSRSSQARRVSLPSAFPSSAHSSFLPHSHEHARVLVSFPFFPSFPVFLLLSFILITNILISTQCGDLVNEKRRKGGEKSLHKFQKGVSGGNRNVVLSLLCMKSLADREGNVERTEGCSGVALLSMLSIHRNNQLNSKEHCIRQLKT